MTSAFPILRSSPIVVFGIFTAVNPTETTMDQVPDAPDPSRGMEERRDPARPDRLDPPHVAEPLLGVDRPSGERAYIRRQPGGRLFVTASPLDTLLFPVGHPREGQSRYHWTSRRRRIGAGLPRRGSPDA